MMLVSAAWSGGLARAWPVWRPHPGVPVLAASLGPARRPVGTGCGVAVLAAAMVRHGGAASLRQSYKLADKQAVTFTPGNPGAPG